MKRIISWLLAAMLTMNLIQVNNISYAKEIGTTAESNTEATSSVQSEDMVISGTNAIGSMLEDELTEVTAEREQNNGYNVFAIEVEGTTATVEYEAVEDCQLLVSIYDNEGIQMLGSGKVDVLETETEATVTIDIDSMPTYFHIRAYLIEKDTLVPLCQEYNSELYTQAMQEFLAKTPEDFDAERVLEIEEESNSFVVFGDATKIIPYNADYNTIEQMDETSKEYVIANPDENFTALQSGDIFSYEYEDGQVLIVDIATIEHQEGKLVITGNEADMNEVFDYVRIDTDFSTGDSTVDPSTCDEDVTYLGRTNADEAAVAGVEAPSLQTTAGGYSTSNAEKKISSSDEVEFKDTYKVGKKDAKGNPIGFYGSLVFTATGALKVYRAKGAEYIELSLTITIDGTVQFTGKFDDSLKLGRVPFSVAPGVDIEIVPQIEFKIEAALKYEAKAEFVIGVRGDKNGIKNITKKPTIEHKLNMEGKVYIGLSLSPKLKVVNDNLFKVSLNATAGVEFQLENQGITTNEKKGIQHDCVDCFEGDVRFKLDLSASLQLCDIDWFKFTKNFLNVDKKISDMYASLSYGEFGMTKCPHVKYRITAMAVDVDKLPLQGVTICDKYKTDADGMVEFYLKRGKYQATAEKDGYIYALNGMIINRFEVKDKEQELHFLMLPDLSAGDGGSEEGKGQKLIVNSSFEDGLNGWEWYINDDDDVADARFIETDSETIEISVINAGNSDWAVQLYQADLLLEEGKKYEISVTLSTNQTRQVVLALEEHNMMTHDATAFGREEPIIIPGQCQTITFVTDVIAQTIDNGKLYIGVGNMTGNESGSVVTIYDANVVAIEDVDISTDTNIATNNLITKYSVASQNAVVKLSEPVKNTVSVETNDEENESSEHLQEQNWITSTATDTQNTYSGLYPNETYNFYVFKEAPTDIPFDSVFIEKNLLYMKQYTSDANGSITLEYAPADDNTDAIEILVCARKTDIAEGYEAYATDLTYNGKKQTPSVTLYVQDKTLVEGKDFRIEGDIIVSEIGDYTLTLVGIGKYTGEVEVTFSIVGEKAVPVTDIALNQTELKLIVGEKSVLSATITPNDASVTALMWVSTNQSVATVDAMGNVMAVGEGVTDIAAIATDGSGVYATCKVTVVKKPEQPTGTDKETTEMNKQPTETENPSIETDTLPVVGTVTTLSSGQYKVTKSDDTTKEVTYAKPTNSKKSSITIPASVSIDGQTYKVTAIADKAFKNNKKLKSVTIGKNVKKIGKEAFYNCKNLKKITIKSTVLNSVGKNAIKGINKKATFKVPKKQYTKYKKLFKSKTGYKKTMKIKK